MASSRSTEYSYVMPGDTNSLFTRHLLDGLRGAAPGPGGVIRVFDLFDYVQPRVTADEPQQHPIFKAEIEENFPVALYAGGKAPPPAPPTPPAEDYAFDAFVNYSGQKADRRWVRDTLLPHLEKAGLRVTADFRAPLGVPKITFAEDAVQHSRYTLVVLSPAYLDSSFAEFDGLLGQHLGQEQARYRVLPLMVEECMPRLGLRILPILDMSDEEEFEINVERLVYQLRQPPEGRRR
jgi:hypothetical protein